MRWDNYQTRFAKRLAKVNFWHLYFACYPIEISGRIYWLEKIWRKGREDRFRNEINYDYRALEDDPYAKV